ncbi:MAG: TonB-dependent receptor [Bacteroidota bacterium]
MRRLLSCFVYICFIGASIGYAQNAGSGSYLLSGQVIDEEGEYLIGATVQSRLNPLLGVLTDKQGNFSISLPSASDTLYISYLGYKKQLVPIAGKASLEVIMVPELQTLDEVVVVGFGTQKKRFTTGAISNVKGEDLQNATQTTVDGALQGRIAGVQVTTSSAMAGSPVSIRIRGTSSIVASSEPLYVVDGVPVVSGNYSKNNASSWRLATAHESNALAQLNPADIESIEVLKDASAAAIYGSRGANGVVLITTKRGKAGKTQFDASYQTGFSQETNRIEMLDGPTYLELAQEAWANSHADALADSDPDNDSRFDTSNDFAKFWSTLLPPGLSKEKAQATNTDWIDKALQQGFFNEMNLSASGGNDKTLFYIGGTYRDEQGIFVGNNFERYNTRVNIDHKPTKNLSIGARTAFTITDSDIIPIAWAGGLGTAQSQALPFWPVYNDDGTFFNAQSGNNVVAELENTDMNQRGTSILGNVYAQLTFLDHFTLRGEFGINNIYKNEFYYRSAIIEPDAISTSVLSESLNWNTNNTLSYSNEFGAHAIDVLVGMNATKNDFYANIIDGETFPNPSLRNPENAATQTASINTSEFSFLSFLSRLNYRFKDRYLLSASVRRDGSSRFGQGNRWGTFPAASIGWIISEESFLRGSSLFSFMKLRASYGEVGNAEIGNFEYFGSFATNNYVDMPGIVVNEIDNTTLGWEASRQYNVGLDFGIKEGRIEVGIDAYLKETTDLLTEVEVSALSGVDRITTNVGSLENKGIDFTFTSHNFIGKFKWVSNLNLNYNVNKITDLGGRAFIPGQTFGLGAVAEGYPVGARFTVPFVGIASDNMMLSVTDPNTGEQVEIQVQGGDELYLNQSGETTNIYNPNDQRFLGNPTPVWTGGLTNNFSWKGLDLNILFTFAAGHDMSNEEQRFQYFGFGYGWNMWANAVDRWQNPGDQTHMHRLTWAPERPASDRFIYDADFIRLRDLTLGYNFSKSLISRFKLSNLRVYARGTNLATFTQYEGWDPEYNRDEAGNVGQGKSWLPSPQARTISFGLNVSF